MGLLFHFPYHIRICYVTGCNSPVRAERGGGVLVQAMKAASVTEVGFRLLLFVISVPVGVGRYPDVLSAGPVSRMRKTRGWVGPTVGFDALRRDKFLFPGGNRNATNRLFYLHVWSC
jgi:hypothetical protein